jgi:hypothetical protein
VNDKQIRKERDSKIIHKVILRTDLIEWAPKEVGNDTQEKRFLIW